jgi:hypothetical protein
MFKIAFCVLVGVNSLFRAFITAVVILLVVADSLYETAIGMRTSDYALYLRTHPPALALFIAMYALVGVFFYIIVRWWS